MPSIKTLTLVFLTLGLALFFNLPRPALAQTTTTVDANNSPYTVPSNQIASGDTVIVVDGGSLANGSLDVISGGTLEFATTATAQNPMAPTTGLSGNGTVIKSGSGTLRYQALNTTFSGTTELRGGTFTTPSFSSSAQAFGTSGTLQLAGGFFSPAGASLPNGFTLSQKELIITADGGGVDFTANTGNQVIEGYNPVTSKLGITGSGSLTIRGIGGTIDPQAGGNPGSDFVRYTGYANPTDAYSGSTLLDGGLFTAAGTYSPLVNGGSPFGTSTVTLKAATISSFSFPSDANAATLAERTFTVPNDIILDAAGGATHSFYINSQSFNQVDLTGVVSGAGTLTNLYGLTTLSGANTFTGDTRLGAYAVNVLNLNNVDGLATSTLDMNASDLGTLGLASPGTFYRLGGLEGSRNLFQATPGAWALEIGLRDENNTFSGNLGQAGLSGYDGIIKSGTGTFEFTGDLFIPDVATVVDPGMTITGGVLAVDSDRSLGVTLSTNTVNTVAMTIDGGTLKQATAFTVGRPIELGSGGGTLDTSAAGSTDLPAFNGVISGTANLTIAANGDLTGTATGGTVLGASNTYTGTTTIASGMVVVTSSFGNAANQLILDGGGLLASGGTANNPHATQMAQNSGTLRAAGASDVLNQAGVLSGSGDLLAAGSGTVNLQAANTHSGSTRAVGGTLNLAHADALQSSLLDMDGADTGTVGFTAGTTTYNVGGLQGSRNLAFNAGTLSVGGNDQSTAYSGELRGTGVLAKAGAGTLTLSGANSYSGGTTVSAGTLAGAVTSLQGAITNNATVEFAQATDGSYAGAMSGTGALLKTGAGTLTLSGTNVYSGGTTVAAGTLKGSATNLQGSIANNATVEFAQATAGTYAGVMSGTGALVKTGAGALTLSGNNSYGGTTTVSAGTLLINGNQSAATGSLSVLSGATLGGSGTIGGNVSVAGIHSPGNSPGVQTINGDLAYSTGSSFSWELIDNTTGGTGNYDQIVLPSGNLTFSGATVLDMAFNAAGSLVDWENTFWAVDRNWLLYDLSSGTTTGIGNFSINVQDWLDGSGTTLSASSRAGASFNLALVGQDVTLNYVAPVPEPGTLALAAIAGVAGLTIRRRRKQSPSAT